jgi:hypothetical protein
VKLLSAGINVVTTSTTRLVNPHAYEPTEWRDQLVGAAKEGQIATAMRVVNAVPYIVIAAEPGLLSSVDLPLTMPRGAFSQRD